MHTTVIAIVNASAKMNKQSKHEKIHLTHHFPSSASPMTSYVKKKKKKKNKQKSIVNRKKPGTIIEKYLCQLSKKPKGTGTKQ